jgi:hypothetical protein
MALIFADGFNHYSTSELAAKWDTRSSASNNVINSGTGQNGSNSWRQTSNNYLEKNFPLGQTFIFGAWLKFTGTSASNTILFELLNGANSQFNIAYNDRFITIRRLSTIISVSNYKFTNNEEHYIECKVTLHDINGSYEVRVNGGTIAAESGINTTTSSLAANRFRLGQQTAILGTVDWDDFYLLDSSGSMLNDFLGPIHIETLLPNGVGVNSEWDVLTGPNNYQDVDESPPDGDTSYVFSNTVGEKDTYAFSNLSMTAGTIHAVRINHYARKTGIGTRTINTAVVSNSTNYQIGPANSIISVYKFLSNNVEVDPNTSSAWSISGLNSAEFGPHLVS